MFRDSTYAVFLPVVLVIVGTVGVTSVMSPQTAPQTNSPSPRFVTIGVYYDPAGFEIPCITTLLPNGTRQGCFVNYEVALKSNQTGWLWSIVITGGGMTKNITDSQGYVKGELGVFWSMKHGWAPGDTVSVTFSFSLTLLQPPTVYEYQHITVEESGSY